MSRKTMFVVGMLAIAMLVTFGASAGSPARIEDGLVQGSRAAPPVEDYVMDEPPDCHTIFDPPLNYADSWGGIITGCPCPCPQPLAQGEDGNFTLQ